jgi:hypothetical protein
MHKICIAGWLLLGALLGWAASICLWEAHCLDPSADHPQMLFVIVGCMALASAYGARKHRALLPRLIAYPLLFAGATWIMGPTSDDWCKLRQQAMYANFFYPVFVIPAGLLGGIIAIVFGSPSKARWRGEERN